MKNIIAVATAVFMAAGLWGCGGGSSEPAVQKLSTGKATLAFSAMSTAKLDNSIGGIDIEVALPPGMSIATTGGGSGSVDSGSLVPGAAVQGSILVYGNYSASTRKARIAFTTSSNSYRSGEFLRLVCSVDGSANVTAADVRALNNPVVVIKAAGYDGATLSTILLTGKVKVTMDVLQ
ncbi:lipoprotein, putative [Geotalea daltonii FRC-32]|uniref:Lipoprotein, putative n=1 Tax=Geotalea daltonii (strain DSM 22248 / JCM 15807 / FRC-32) TaxID=316067 RepID=B9M401_GEODF|nr:hypothetical protein [Geotalea daltonii]ACM19644.1 lipoprotein, putative [Geotalea daltonii FRC-32]